VLVGPIAAGWYAGVARIAEGSKTAHVALTTASYPAMADRRDRRAVLARARRLNLAMAAVVATVLIIGGRFLIDHLYGASFAPSKPALTILAVGLVASCVATFETLSMLADHREREVMKVMAACLAVLVVGVIALVGALGWTGACWAMLAADALQAVLLTRCRTRR
jgi:O-antigen/teichoic acid export membrane protein